MAPGLTSMQLAKEARENQEVGAVVSRLTILSISHRNKRKDRISCFYSCRCECGKPCVVSRGYLHDGRNPVKSCGCARTAPGNQMDITRIWNTYRRDARRRGIAFDLPRTTFEGMLRLPCHYCGVGPSNCTPRTAHGGGFLYTGIDRVDSSSGYTESNTAPCCATCNRAKSDSSVEAFRAWIKRLRSWADS
jgi:hypothetical protein